MGVIPATWSETIAWAGGFITATALWLIIFVLLLFTGNVALADDSWINRGGYRNPAGEWCCGTGDCFVVPSGQIRIQRDGYLIAGIEMVPYSEAQPSPDGAYWRCQRPDKTRRCFFAPRMTN